MSPSSVAPTAIFKSSALSGTNGMIGMVYCVTATPIPPSAAFAFYRASIPSFDSADDFINFNFSAAVGFLVTQYISVIELTPNGDIETISDLWMLKWNKVSEFKDPDNDLHSMTIRGINILVNADLEIHLTFVISNKLGLIKYNNANSTTIVTPKSLECIVEILGYKYKNAGNRLQMKIGIITGSTYYRDSIKARIFSSGDDFPDQVYYIIKNGEVFIDGTIMNVNVSNPEDGHDDQKIYDMTKTKYNKPDDDMMYINFPPNAQKITFTTTMGEGYSPYDDVKEDTKPDYLVTVLLIIGGCLLGLIIVGTVVFLYRKNKEYSQIK
jgi:hypothetical protein